MIPVRVGVSACLLGEHVRFDGGHKRDSFLTDVFGRYVEWVTVCPEVEVGLGVPRDSLHLSDPGDGVHLLVSKTGEDLTRRMNHFSAQRLKEIAALQLSGYVLKSNSPSCGMERVRVYRRTGVLHKTGRGLFAEALIQAFPHLPVEEEGRLQDAGLRENFVTRVYTHHRWQELLQAGITRAGVMMFHEHHKFVLASRSQAGARELGALLGKSKTSQSIRALGDIYLVKFTEVMKRTPTRKSHANVLQHLAGFLKDKLDTRDRQELAEVIDRYRRELVPLIVPITLLRHYVTKYDVEYLREQVYLKPHPHELMLLNRV